MHELSVAMSIVDIATGHARAASANHVTEVELDIGTMSGIEYTSLEFALEVASRETLLEKAVFRINRIQPLAACNACGRQFTPAGMFSKCPGCGSNGSRIVRGRELQIKSLLVE